MLINFKLSPFQIGYIFTKNGKLQLNIYDFIYFNSSYALRSSS